MIYSYAYQYQILSPTKYYHNFQNDTNHIGGVVIIMLSSSVVSDGFEH